MEVSVELYVVTDGLSAPFGVEVLVAGVEFEVGDSYWVADFADTDGIQYSQTLDLLHCHLLIDQSLLLQLVGLDASDEMALAHPELLHQVFHLHAELEAQIFVALPRLLFWLIIARAGNAGITSKLHRNHFLGGTRDTLFQILRKLIFILLSEILDGIRHCFGRVQHREYLLRECI